MRHRRPGEGTERESSIRWSRWLRLKGVGGRAVRFNKFAKMTRDFGNIRHALLRQLGARVPNRIEWCYVAANGWKSSIWVREYDIGANI